MDKLYVIKVGGNIIDSDENLSLFLQSFSSVEGYKILVHGGGKLATRMAEALGVEQKMVEGRRITDAETLKIVTMVYAGYINKNIVAQLQSNGCNAIGLCGADANIIQANKREVAGIDYGFAGDINAVNTPFLKNLLEQNMAIVLSPITHNGKGQLLNTNADTIAQETAKALSAVYDVHLIYGFEKGGVLMNAKDDASVIPELNSTNYQAYKKAGIITEGMIPKLDNAFAALAYGVKRVVIGNALNLAQLVAGTGGTKIIHE